MEVAGSYCQKAIFRLGHDCNAMPAQRFRPPATAQLPRYSF